MPPKPPSDDERLLYVNQNKALLYPFFILSFLVLFVSMVRFSMSHESLYWFLGYAVVIFVYLSISYAVGVFAAPFDFDKHNKIKLVYSDIPSLDIYLPVCGEDYSIVSNTVLRAVDLATARPNTKVFVLDDGNSNELYGLCQKQGVSYIRRGSNYLRKAGNLRHAFAQTNGEFILILDADFACRPDFIEELIGYFYVDPTVAIVQSPQFFRVNDKQNWIERGAGFVQELFYRLIQVNRNYWEAPICVGTCAIYRRKALEPFGGTAPIPYSEDLHTGFNVMSAGWKVKYAPINLACGVCPDNLKSFFNQQYRWCMGSISLFFSKFFWQTKLTLWQRLSFLSGMIYYMATAIGIIFIPIPSILVLYQYPEMVHWYNIFFSIPSLISGTVVLAFWSKFPFSLLAIQIREVSYWAHLFALFDKMRGNLMPWTPTGIAAKSDRYESFSVLFPMYRIGILAAVVYGAAQFNFSIQVLPMCFLNIFYFVMQLPIVYELYRENN